MKIINWGMVRSLVYMFYKALGVDPKRIIDAMEQIPQLKLDKED